MKQTGLDDALLTRLVHGFYDRIRRDALLGPTFAERISDWEPHLERMVEFWSSVALERVGADQIQDSRFA
jgi:hemoglobin